jgi:hypothetical protein
LLTGGKEQWTVYANSNVYVNWREGREKPGTCPLPGFRRGDQRIKRRKTYQISTPKINL